MIECEDLHKKEKMMKRVGVTRLTAAGPDDQSPLIITAGPQVFSIDYYEFIIIT